MIRDRDLTRIKRALSSHPYTLESSIDAEGRHSCSTMNMYVTEGTEPNIVEVLSTHSSAHVLSLNKDMDEVNWRGEDFTIIKHYMDGQERIDVDYRFIHCE